MKKARKKRIVRRKRRISEREIMRIKRKLKKSARKLRLGAKRTGAYVYGTLRRIVGNPAIPANMNNPEYVSAYRRAQRMAKSGRPIGIYAFRSGGAWRFGVGEYGATRLPGDELVSIFNAPRGLRGNPSVTMQDIQRIVGKINSEGGNARVVPAGSGGLNLYLDRISPYDGKTIEKGHEYFLRGTKKDIYEALIKIRFVPMYHPYARNLRGNPSLASLHPRDRATAEKFVDYVDSFYGKGGIYAKDFKGGVSRRDIQRAVAIYIDQIRRKKTQWGGGDSIDRERVRMILQPSYSMYIPEGRVTIRKNAERHPYWDSHELMRLYEVLRKTSPRSPYFKSTMGYVWRQLRVKPYQFRTKAKLLDEVRRRFIASQGYVR